MTSLTINQLYDALRAKMTNQEIIQQIFNNIDSSYDLLSLYASDVKEYDEVIPYLCELIIWLEIFFHHFEMNQIAQEKMKILQSLLKKI
jgi:hypothetical protein